MLDFQYNLPINVIFGCGKAELIGKEAAKLGKKALIVTGFSSTKKSGLLERVKTELSEEGVESVLFDRVARNPLTTTVMEGAVLGRAEKCDLVIALGGGSIMDASKAIALMCIADGEIGDYVKLRRQPVKGLPLITVPTTCGTGSEVNGTAVLSDPFTNDKQGMRNNLYIPAASVIDPLLMKTMPNDILCSVGFDALCHNMEAFLSKKRQPLTDLMTLSGMALGVKYLPRVLQDKEDNEAWEAVTLASMYGGMTIAVSSVTAPHGIEHPASGLRNIVHGRGLAALTPVVYEKSLSAVPERFQKIAEILGGTKASDCPDGVRRFLENIGLTTNLSEQGVKEEDVDWMTENCFRVSAMMLGNHPYPLTKEDVRDIYLKAL